MSNKLRLSPYAYSKLVYMRDKGDTEIGGMGVTRAGNPSIVEDFLMIKQEVSAASVEFDGDDIADYIEHMLTQDITPDRCCRVWIHTHPGNSATPSGTDEKTFKEIFGTCSWAVMAILAKNGSTTCRLAINGQWEVTANLSMECDWTLPFGPSDHEAWDKEYDDFVTKKTYLQKKDWSSWNSTVSKEPETQWGEWQKTKTGMIKKYPMTRQDWIVCSDCEHLWQGDLFRTSACPKCQSLRIEDWYDWETGGDDEFNTSGTPDTGRPAEDHVD